MDSQDIPRSVFDPNGPGIRGRLFGLPFTASDAELIIVPVPWEVTVSYHAGTALAPSVILEASTQVDLAVRETPGAWKKGIHLLDLPEKLYEESKQLRELSYRHIELIESGKKITPDDPVLRRINEACENLNIYVRSTVQKLLSEGKRVGLLGGDHSTPLGFIRALAERYERFGILQIDAHADLRKAYEGFTYSHASIMYNVLKLPAVNRLVQVGIRDYCDEELEVIKRSMGRVVTFFDQDLKEGAYTGRTWDEWCAKIIRELPTHVYISFDIDGLSPDLCPSTGTPVPGGLSFEQANHLFKRLVESGKKIIGFDLVEVAAGQNDWDANVGARMLYRLCNWTLASPK